MISKQAYPEGGDLIAGVENGLYIEAFTPVGDPADIEALISKSIYIVFNRSSFDVDLYNFSKQRR